MTNTSDNKVHVEPNASDLSYESETGSVQDLYNKFKEEQYEPTEVNIIETLPIRDTTANQIINLEMNEYRNLLVAHPSKENEIFFTIANKLYLFNTENRQPSVKVYQDKPAILKFVIRKDGKIIIAYENKIVLIKKDKNSKDGKYIQVGK